MKIFKKTIYTLLAGAAMAGTTTGCSDFLEEHSQDLAKVESWSDLDEVLIGNAYMRTGDLSMQGGERNCDFDFLHFMTDEITMVDDRGGDDMDYGRNLFPYITWQADCGIDYQQRFNGNDDKYWNTLYDRINICNMVIALIDEQPEVNINDGVQKKRVKGEAYFLRGYFYFILANLYSEPYDPATAESKMGVAVKNTEYVEDVEFERGNLSDTYKSILSDLEVASENLEGVPSKSIYRGDINAVNLLLSRVYLYMQNWDKAIEYAQKVIADHGALLDLATVAPGSNSVSATSPETIFSTCDYVVSMVFADQRRYVAPFVVSEDIRDMYTNADLRKTRYIGTTESRPAAGAFLKYNGQVSHQGTICDYGSTFSMRSPEAYLILAEASAYKGDDATAQKALETFLATRMTGSVKVDKTGNDLIDFIRDERVREFLIEGHRWFDLRRYTVCGVRPWSKAIEHAYYYFDGYENLDHTEYFRLEENDPAYTMAVPRNIISYQVSLGTVVRPQRAPYLSE